MTLSLTFAKPKITALEAVTQSDIGLKRVIVTPAGSNYDSLTVSKCLKVSYDIIYVALALILCC